MDLYSKSVIFFTWYKNTYLDFKNEILYRLTSEWNFVNYG